jgi:hypothetical protein
MRRFLLMLTVITSSAWSQTAEQQPPLPVIVKVEMPPTPPRDFLGYLQALGPLIATTVAVGTALMQYYLQRQQSKQNLFDKRFIIYTAVKRYLSQVATGDDEQTPSGYQSFVTAKNQAEYLFGPEVLRFIQEFDKLNLERKLHQDPEPEWIDATFELIHRAQDDVEELFRPYLQIHQEQSWLARFIAHVDRWVDSDQPAAMASRRDV